LICPLLLTHALEGPAAASMARFALFLAEPLP